MDQPLASDAVLLMAYGAARSLEEIPAYLADIRGGRPPSEELVAEVRRRYEAIGGSSPLFEITQAQADGLARALEARGVKARVAVAMRHSEPTIAEVVSELAGQGVRRLAGLPLTPFQSALSVGAYFKKLSEAGSDLDIRRCGDWHAHPRLISAYAARIREAAAPGARLLLSAHSLPSRILDDGDPYPAQLEETAALVARAAGFSEWRFAYQSRGATAEPWLGPEAGDVLEELAKEGAKAVLLCPLGFVSEHMETLYDDDVLYKGKAQALGLAFSRAKALNDHPDFLAALADAAAGALS